MNNYDIGKQEAKLRLDRLGQCANDEILVNDRRTKKGWYCRKGIDLKNPVQPVTERPPKVPKKKSNTGLIVGTGIVGTALLGGALILGSKGSGDTPPKTTVKAENPKEKELQAKATELAGKEARLAQNQKRNQDWETELNQRSQELEKKQGDLDGFAKANQGKEKELKSLSQELTKQKTDLDQVVKKNQEKETEINQRSQQLSQQEEIINKRSQELGQMQSDIEKQAKLNLETKKSLDQRSSLLDEKEQELTQREQALSEKEQEILGREQAIVQKEKKTSAAELKRKAEEEALINEQKKKDFRDQPLNPEEKARFMSDITDQNLKDARRHLTISKETLEQHSKPTTPSGQKAKEYGLDEPELASLLSYTAYGYVGANELLRGKLKQDTPVSELSGLLTRQFNEAINKLPLYQETEQFNQAKLLHEQYQNLGEDFYPIERSALHSQKLIDEWEEGGEIKLHGFLSTSPKGVASSTAGEQYRKKKVKIAGQESLPDNISVPETTKTGKRAEIIRDFGISSDPTEKEVVFKIKDIKTGRYIDSVLSSTHPDGGEVVFPTNTPFKILSKTYNKEKGCWEIALSEIDYNLNALNLQQRQKKDDSIIPIFGDGTEYDYLPDEVWEWRFTYPIEIVTTWRPSWSL